MTWRGGERQVYYLMESLSTQSINQHLLCSENSEISSRVNTSVATTHVKPKPSSISLSWAKEVKRICQTQKIDIIHAHDSKSQTFAVLGNALFNINIPVILTRRVLFPVKGKLSLFKYNHPSIKKIICISSAVQKEMQKTLKVDKTIIIPSSIDTHKFETTEKKDFNLIENKTKIGYVAALTEEKDHNTFIETANLILQNRDDVHFYIVGSGKLEKEIQTKIAELNLTEHISLTGFIKEIDAFIPQLDLLLFTSLSEGLGSTILDFFLCKKPVVSTKCGGNEDIVFHRKTGMLAEKKDSKSLAKYVEEVLNNESLKEEIIENAYKLVKQKYSLNNISKETLKVYTDSLG
ncbi:glycosyltransferase family 4 protein [Sediminitomix flava]|nr:glycosyltransferase family 4 protein [Sediminitomix flava]